MKARSTEKNYTKKKIGLLNINILGAPLCKFSPNTETFLIILSRIILNLRDPFSPRRRIRTF